MKQSEFMAIKIKSVVGIDPLFCTLVLKHILMNYKGFILFSGLWDEKDGFYYDHVRNNQNSWPLKIKSVVGLVPLFCTLVLKDSDLKHHPGFHKRTRWFIENRKDLAKSVSICLFHGSQGGCKLLCFSFKDNFTKEL